MFCVSAMLFGCEKDPKHASKSTQASKLTLETPIVSPGLISLEQAIGTMGLEAKNRVSLRLGPLATAGISQEVVRLLPPNIKSKYEKFIADSTFDPIRDIVGGVAYTDHDLSGSSEMSNATVIVAMSDGTLEALIEYAARAGVEEENEENTQTIILLTELSVEERKRCSDHLQIAGKGDLAYQHKDLGDANLIYSREGTYAEYLYVWSGGVLVSAVNVGNESVLEAIAPSLRGLVGELARTSRFVPKAEPSVVLDGWGFVDAAQASFTVRVDDKTTVNLAVVMPPDSSISAKQIEQGWPDLQETALLGSFAPRLQSLVLHATEATEQKGRLVFHTELQTSSLSDALANVELER